MTHGYYRSPTVHDSTVVFLCEDDLWSVPLSGGMARRLTTSVGAAANPCFSPDGKHLAFIAREEGAWEVFVMPSAGDAARRLSYQGATPQIAGWTPDSKKVIYASEASSPFDWARHLWEVPCDGGLETRLPYGVANRIAFGPGKQMLLGRHIGDPARWKRYRGGTVGQFWIDSTGARAFAHFNPTGGNVTSPMWVGNRIYFISDHEGIGNIYSCTAEGHGLKRHTHLDDFYARGAQSDGKHIVFHAGGALYRLDLKQGACEEIDVRFHSPRTQVRLKFAGAGRHLQEFAMNPKGNALAVTARGKLFSFHNWEGPVLQHGAAQGVRYRLTEFLNDGKRLVTVSDADGEEAIEIHHRDHSKAPVRLDAIDIGRPTGLQVSPKADMVAVPNHRFELLLVDLKKKAAWVLDQSKFDRITGVSWSPDGQWVAYAFADSPRTRGIKVCRVQTGEVHAVTRPEFNDVSPSWDPDGRFLYFLSYRTFNPVYDALHFELGFPKAMRPMLVTLRGDIPNPFVPVAPGDASAKKAKKKKDKDVPVTIHFEGIADRVLAFPCDEGRYGKILGIPGKALFTVYPVEGALGQSWRKPSARKGQLKSWDFKGFKETSITGGVSTFDVSRDGKMLAYLSQRELRVVKAGEKPPEDDDDNAHDGGRSSGFIDLERIRLAVHPPQEWRQMFREAWRLQRDHFWSPNMSGVDWERIYRRYLPLLDRLACRSEFSDVMWEMQGELGTSHAYEAGGDYRIAPHVSQGSLGADFQYDAKKKGYRIAHLARGDSWETGDTSPLAGPGVGLAAGDVITAINGQALDREHTPGRALVHRADHEVQISVTKRDGKQKTFNITALHSDSEARYREWVQKNRAYVHRKTRDKAGYIHIPDMGPYGFAEFHRGWLAELQYPALIIDVRYNGGGHVSQLLLEKLSRRRLGYDVPRWHQPEPYPSDSVLGPMVALTNEAAGSDGDIFSHAFKMLKLGPLIGKRTWGGVIGINPSQVLSDGTITTQPEFSFWFEDVGWGVENYGTDPDIEVEIRPQDYIAGRDPQLDRAIEEVLSLWKQNPPQVPNFDQRPNLKLPRLPKV
ncbi:MAG: PD40 domain-containing protein [Candidatus Hydrogenedentes bacterium]|nr:PD40 domain-containing protein [Candidatus Hydrogenedentota bacterium]